MSNLPPLPEAEGNIYYDADASCGGWMSTKKAYTADQLLAFAEEAVRLEREATDELLRDCAAFFASNVKIAPTDANAKAAELWNRLDAAIRARSQEGQG